MKNKQQKRGRGRPKKGPLNLAEERSKVRASIAATAKRLGTINYHETAEALETMLSEDKLKECTHAELKELRRMAERLWDQIEIERQYQEDLEWGYGVKRESTPQSEAWDKEHEFLKPKRKNSKKTKNIHTLTDKQKLKKGMSLEPVAMEMDLDATEAELEAKLMERAKEELMQARQFLVGRRVAQRAKADPTQQKKSFWI